MTRLNPHLFIGDVEGLLFDGSLSGTTATTGGVPLAGLVLTVNFTGGEAESNVIAITDMLGLALDGN